MKHDKTYSRSILLISVAVLAMFTFLGDLERTGREYVRAWTSRVLSASGLQNTLDKRIKFFRFDDRTRELLKRDRLSDLEVLNLAIKLRKAGAAHVIITTPMLGNDEEPQKLQNVAMNIKILNGVDAAVLLVDSEILAFDEFLVKNEARSGLNPIKESPFSSKISATEQYAYSSPAILNKAFAQIGYLGKGHGTVAPLLRVREDNLLPYLGLVTASKLSFLEQDLYLNDTLVTRNSDGTIPLQMIEKDHLSRKTLSIGSFLVWLAKEQDASKIIGRGDIVVIGSTSLAENVDPRNIELLSFVNSLKKGEWIYYNLPVEFVLWVMFLMLLQLLVPRLTGRAKYFSLVGVTSGVILSLPFLFYQSQIEFNWLFALPLGVFATFAQMKWRDKAATRDQVNLRESLRHALPEASISKLTIDTQDAVMDSRKAMLALLQIDLSGLTAIAENFEPQTARNFLEDLLEEYRAIIFSNGGLIDASYSNGILCVFGHHLVDSRQDLGSVDLAVKCAVELQKKNLHMMETEDKSVIPLRVSIGYGELFVGNVGSREVPQFSVYGSVIEQVQQVCDSCEPHTVLLSKEALKEAENLHELELQIEKRMFKPRSKMELVEAYEINPFREGAKGIKEIDTRFRQLQNRQRVDERWPQDWTKDLKATALEKDAYIVDISRAGACLLLKEFYGVGVDLSFKIDNDASTLNTMLKKNGLGELSGVVKWGKKKGDLYIHGIHFDRMSDEKKDLFEKVVTEFMSNGETSAV